MTPQEELFAQLFNSEKIAYKAMDTLERRAHREMLSKIAFEARVCITAADAIEQEEKKEKIQRANSGKPTGFARSVNTDETTSNAINTVKERQKKMSGKEKMLANLIDLYVKGGMTRSEAEKVATDAMGANKILEQMKSKESKSAAVESLTSNNLHSPLSQENGFTIVRPKDQPAAEVKESPADAPAVKVTFNPFAK